jgi:hypothetical protein
MVMVRKQVYLTPTLERELKREAARRGLSEAALIRERLGHHCAQSPADNEAARKRFLKMLREIDRKAEQYKGPDLNWKFDREDAYEERLERQMPR